MAGEVVPVFITALESACSEASLNTLEGIKQCHDKCQTHLCCFSDADDCVNVHEEACDAYKPCERLVTPHGGNPVPSPSLEGPPDFDLVAKHIEKACAVLFDSQDWVAHCHGVCADRFCCLVDANIGSNCRATVGIEECNAYSSCDVLINGSGKEITDGKQLEDKFLFGGIGNVCSSRVANDSSLSDACKERCNTRSCCFEETPAYSCYSMEREWCEEFQSCSYVGLDFYTEPEPSTTSVPTTNPVSVTHPSSNSASSISDQSTPRSFKSLCTEFNLEENLDVCKSHCSRYECCFRSENSCFQKNSLECLEYYICEEFYMDDTELGLPGNSGSATHNSSSGTSLNSNVAAPKFDEFQARIEAACSPESLKSLEGIEQCYNKCQAHLCCVPADALEADFDCSDTYPDECNSYYVCERLVSLYNLWTPPSTSFDPYAVKIAVNAACTLSEGTISVTKESVAKCHQVCEARMCCLAHPTLGSSCVETLGEDECGDYSACKVLIGGDASDLGSSIEDVCNGDVSSDKELFSDCREKCNERSCCFEDKPYSCYGMEEGWCNEYESCELVGFTFLGSATTETNQVENTGINEDFDLEKIDTKCSEEYLLAFGLKECEYLCESVKCCFDFSQCTYPNESVCKRASACDNVYNPSSEDLIVAKLCSEEELEANELPCQDACDLYECCFTNTPCSSSIDAECPQYEPCRNYFETFKPDFQEPSFGSSSSSISSGSGQGNNFGSGTSDLNNRSFKTLCTTLTLEENWEFCKSHCSRYECCFRSVNANSCYQQNQLECDEYYICEEFYKDTDPGNSAVAANNSGSGLASNVASSASNSNMQQSFKNVCTAATIGQNWDTCKNHCLRYECCFRSVNENSCYQQNELECDEYYICEEFYKDTDPGNSAVVANNALANNENPGSGSQVVASNTGSLETMKSLCSPPSLEQNLADCGKWCINYECCFYFSNSCYLANKQECDDHDSCRLVFDGLRLQPNDNTAGGP